MKPHVERRETVSLGGTGVIRLGKPDGPTGGDRRTTSDAHPSTVTAGNSPRSGATAPSVSHSTPTLSTPTPPTEPPSDGSKYIDDSDT